MGGGAVLFSSGEDPELGWVATQLVCDRNFPVVVSLVIKAEGGGAFAAAELPSELRLSLMSMLGFSWKPRDVEDLPNASRTIIKRKRAHKNIYHQEFYYAAILLQYLHCFFSTGGLALPARRRLSSSTVKTPLLTSSVAPVPCLEFAFLPPLLLPFLFRGDFLFTETF